MVTCCEKPRAPETPRAHQADETVSYMFEEDKSRLPQHQEQAEPTMFETLYNEVDIQPTVIGVREHQNQQLMVRQASV